MYQSNSSFVCSKRKKRCQLVNGNDYVNRKLCEDEKACFWSLTNKKASVEKQLSDRHTLWILSVRLSPSFSFSVECVRRSENPSIIAVEPGDKRHGHQIDINSTWRKI